MKTETLSLGGMEVIPHNGSLIMTKALAETLIILAIILWNENPFGVFSKSDSSLF